MVGGQPKGKRPQEQPLRVGGIFSVGMYEYDMHLTLASLPTVQGLLGRNGPAVSGVEIRLGEAVRAPEMKQAGVVFPTKDILKTLQVQ